MGFCEIRGTRHVGSLTGCVDTAADFTKTKSHGNSTETEFCCLRSTYIDSACWAVWALAAAACLRLQQQVECRCCSPPLPSLAEIQTRRRSPWECHLSAV
jgi:hypothetical protein